VSALAWLLPGLPLLAGAGLACSGRRGDRRAPALGIAVAVTTLGLALAAATTGPTGAAPFVAGLPVGLGVDGLSGLLACLVALVLLAVLAYTAGELAPGEPRARFVGLMLVFAAAMLVTVTATTVAALLAGWEVMGATSYALIGFSWRDRDRVAGGLTAFVTTRLADVGLYLAAGAVLAAGPAVTGGGGLARLPALPAPWSHLAAAGIGVAALGKSAQLPFSFWLSGAMRGPSPVSALLHSATMVAAGAYLLLRVHPLLAATGWAAPAAAWAGAVTALVMALVAVAQTDLKQLLAASTCSQVGFMVLAAGVGGVGAGTAQLVAHAVTKSLLFLAAGTWLTALGTKDLRALRGAARSYPGVGVCAAVGLLALAGLPPLSLWATKDGVLAAALARSPALYAVGLAAAGLSAVYAVRPLVLLLRPGSTDNDYDSERRGTRHVSALQLAALAGLAGPATILGILALPAIARRLDRAVAPLAAGVLPASPAGWSLAASAALAVAGSALAWRRPWHPLSTAGRVAATTAGWWGRWLGIEDAARALVVRPTLRLAHALAAVDDRGLDRLVLAAGRGVTALARGAAWADDRGLDGVVRGIAGGAVRAGQWARRPQTGQLHQYYAQMAVGLGVLLLVLLSAR